jgi:NAD(P)-dependent dehydrogenase (short-subunit alcohol dehydrogenase family)
VPLDGLIIEVRRTAVMNTRNLFDLTDKVVIVTGSTKGIGRAMAQGVAEAGGSVVVNGRKQDLCDAVAEEIAAATGADVVGLACHVGNWDAVPRSSTVSEDFREQRAAKRARPSEPPEAPTMDAREPARASAGDAS